MTGRRAPGQWETIALTDKLEADVIAKDSRIAELEADLRNIRDAAGLGSADGSIQQHIANLTQKIADRDEYIAEFDKRKEILLDWLDSMYARRKELENQKDDNDA